MVWTTLAHHIDFELLKEAYRLTRKDGAVGVDGQTAKEYGENLEENLQDLSEPFQIRRLQGSPGQKNLCAKRGREEDAADWNTDI